MNNHCAVRCAGIQQRLRQVHPLDDAIYQLAFGQTRQIGNTAHLNCVVMRSFGSLVPTASTQFGIHLLVCPDSTKLTNESTL